MPIRREHEMEATRSGSTTVNDATTKRTLPKRSAMRRSSRAVLTAVACMILLQPSTAFATATSSARPKLTTCSLPESDAEGLFILSDYRPGYWWDHAHLTIAVQATPKAAHDQVVAIHRAIATWTNVLSDCFLSSITLTDVTGTQPSEQRAADIVVHLVPTAGGVVWVGVAKCGDHGCSNVQVRYIWPPSLGYVNEAWFTEWIALHEIGHSLGLGHATNVLESSDLMGYGWFLSSDGVPVLSRCDLEAVAFVFSWAFEGGEPHAPGSGPFAC